MQSIRARIVNFRVTEAEFEKLKSALDRDGARCMSDFARNVMLSRSNPGVDEKLVSLERRVVMLEDAVSRLSKAFQSPNAAMAASEGIER